jgi:ATP-dependent exoDNAse (exonuclease V) beta subunit
MTAKNFTIYKSSAGSGKTFTLVKEYLLLALNDGANPPQAYKHILAITFTNKASAEMKERIIKALKELSESDHNIISSGTKALKEIIIADSNGKLTESTIRVRAQRVLTAILHNYSDFAISTIDSFVHKVIRTFAYDLKIPMTFEIEMDDEKLLTQAIDLMIAEVGTNELLTKALVAFAESKTDDEKSWHIEKDLLMFAKNLLNEDGIVHIDKLRDLNIKDFIKIRNTLSSELKQFETSVINEAKKAADFITKAGLTSKDFYQTDKGIGIYFQKLANGRMDSISPNSYVQTTVGDDKWAGGKASNEVKSAIAGIKYILLKCFQNIQILKDENYSDYVLFTLINKNMYSLAVLNEIEKVLIEYKSENNILHISEFNKLINKIVSNEPVPFIYERLGERYTNYLIDEFQDTSVLQFQNLLPLIDNSLAAGHFTMLVGDGKQAIYRWRGGEVEQFAMLPEVYLKGDNPLVEERENALIRNHNPRILSTNFRSKKEVIEFNNDIFKVLATKLNEKYQTIYKDLRQEFSPANIGGLVSIEFIAKEKEEFREENRKRTLEIIEQLKTENFKLSDIAILVRKNSDGNDIANYLTYNNIPVISSDSLLLSNSKEINFIHSLMKYITDPNNNITHTELLEFLFSHKYIDSASLSNVLEEKNTTGILTFLKSAATEFNMAELSRMPLYELCEELIRIFMLNKTPDAYIQFFLDEVLNFSINKNNNLSDFIVYWEEQRLKSSLVISEGMNAVNVMTIHRSKGLEFPVVILPFNNGLVTKGKDYLWLDLENEKLPELGSAIVPVSSLLEQTEYADKYVEEDNKSLLDSLNVLYVALTRAEERLYVMTGKFKNKVDKLSSLTNMFSYYIESKGKADETKTVYTFGNPSPHIEKKKRESNLSNIKLETFYSNKWRDSIKIRGASKALWDVDLQAKKDYGILVHAALAKIKTEDETADVLNAMFMEGIIDEEKKEELQILISNIIQLPELKPYFAKGLTIKNEAEIISLSGDFYRPDRVVFFNKTAVIIDYKTGEQKPEHKKQIFGYADLLAEMGFTVKEKLLVYVEDNLVVRC